MNTKVKVGLFILEVVVSLIIIIYLAITKYWPEYQESLGSSEKLFLPSIYATGVEIKITTGPELFLVIDKEEKVAAIFFENEQATYLANQEIENKSITKAIPKIIQILIDNKLLDNNTITIINYKDRKVYDKVLTKVKETLTANNKVVAITETSSSLQQKSQEEGLEEAEDDDILWKLYEQSMDILNNDSIEPETNNTVDLTKDLASVYADTIYQKLMTYRVNLNLKDQEINASNMPIQYIPGDSENTIYPTSDSWYYIKDYKIYAEISFKGEKQQYTFCYQGSLEEKKDIGRLSAFCGAISAGIAASSGIAFMLDHSLDAISHTIINGLALASGIICDGAKASCAGKIALALESGILGYEMYKNNSNINSGDGIIKENCDTTIQSVGRLAKKGMKQTDKEILSIMIEK